MNTTEILQYYSNLLIFQYHGKEKATGTIEALASCVVMPQTTVEVISFSSVPGSGAFTLFYGDEETASIPYTATAGDVQTALQALTGLGSVTVTGDFTDGFTVTFTGVDPVALILTEGTNTLGVTITVTETDVILPLAVENAFNLTGDSVAVGAQLDILGKYAGVTRSGQGFTSFITLSDADFLTLIKLAVIKNSAQSDLYSIQTLMFTFFPNQVVVTDFKTMRMSYMFSEAVASLDLLQMVVNQDLIPVPMAVGLAIILAPDVLSFFGFRTYPAAAVDNTPFNDYGDYQTDWPWLSYADSIL